MKKDFGVEDLTANSIHELRKRLEKSEDRTYDYMINKIGLKNNKEEFLQAMGVYTKDGLVGDAPNYSPANYYCLM